MQKKIILLIALLGMTQFAFSTEKTSYTLSGWIDETEFQSTFKIDTNLIKKTNWDEISSTQVKASGYFYTDKSGEAIFKVTKIDTPEKVNFIPIEDEVEIETEIETEDYDSTNQYKTGQNDQQ